MEHLSRDQTFDPLKKYNSDPFHIQHALTVEAVMKWYANELGYGITVAVAPEHEMEKVLFAADELTGLIWAAALIRPSKSTKDMDLKSLKKNTRAKDLLPAVPGKSSSAVPISWAGNSINCLP